MRMSVPDIADIGKFNYEWDFNQEEYEEYLEDNELQRSDDVLMEYIMEYVNFDMEFLDSDTYHTFETARLSYNDIVEEYGEKLAGIVLSDCMRSGSGGCEKETLFDEEIDINNPQELNQAAMNLLRHAEYVKDGRGFILSNGVMVYTPSEHNMCTIINGVKGTFHFIKLGNIRVLPASIDIGREPTQEQYNELRYIISHYTEERIYMTIMSDKDGEIDVTYTYPNPNYVVNEIKRYYREGIKPTNRVFNENRKRKRSIRLTENDIKDIVRGVMAELELL